MRNGFMCEKCNKSFHTSWGLKRHVRKTGNSQCKTVPTGSVECDKCKKSFRSHWFLKRHNESSRECKSEPCIVCKECDKLFLSEWHLKRHSGAGCKGPGFVKVLTSQSNELTKENYTFISVSEFTEWKEKMERETNSHFVKHRGSEKNKNGTTTFKLYCHRSGFYKPRSNNESRLKTCSYKIGNHCPSAIKVTEGSNVIVEFVSSHSCHNGNVERLTLTETEPPSENDLLLTEIGMEIEVISQIDIETEKKSLIENYSRIVTQMVHSEEGLHVVQKNLSHLEFVLKNVDKQRHTQDKESREATNKRRNKPQTTKLHLCTPSEEHTQMNNGIAEGIRKCALTC